MVRAVLADLPKDADITSVAEAIKATAFKITRAGELMAREASKRLGVQQGILDLSLAPTPAEGDSVAQILEAIYEAVGPLEDVLALACDCGCGLALARPPETLGPEADSSLVLEPF